MMHGSGSETTKNALPEGEVHVWRVVLDAIPRSAEGLGSCLSLDEQTRSAQIIGPLERRRFVLSRIVLRHVLARYHGCAAADVPLAREPGGRPFVPGSERLFFSLSHSGDTALVAIADVTVGVDVERVRPVRRAPAIARRILHPDTVATLDALPRSDYEVAFLDAWTQREAHVKAVGGGLFRTADVLPFDLRQPADATVRRAVSRRDGSHWSVARLVPYEATRAAVAAPGVVRALHVLDWLAAEHEPLEEGGT